MDINEEKVPFINIYKNGNQGIANIKYQVSPTWLEIEIEQKSVSTEGIDIFECFSILRTQLEQEGIRLLCNGCDRTFGVNEFLSQMESGLYGVMGSSAIDAKEKYIFEPNIEIDYATVSEQRAYQRESSKEAIMHARIYVKTELLKILKEYRKVIHKEGQIEIVGLINNDKLEEAIEKFCTYLNKQNKKIDKELFRKIEGIYYIFSLDNSIIENLERIVKN